MIDATFALPIRDPEYPCLGARSTRERGTAVHQSFSSLHDSGQLDALADALRVFSEDCGHDGEPRSFIALFPNDSHTDAGEFERSLWELLLDLHSRDVKNWPDGACRVPGATEFRYYFDGHPWFVVGMSPALERRSRRSPITAFAFNPSVMFERLRASGQYDRFAAVVTSRDLRYSGVSYASAARHPELGDAPQYAGREFSAAWRCPLPVHFDDVGAALRSRDSQPYRKEALT